MSDKVKILIIKMNNLQNKINTLENNISYYKKDIKNIKKELLKICKHNNITEERDFDGHQVQYYHFCNTCQSYLDWNLYLKLKNTDKK